LRRRFFRYDFFRAENAKCARSFCAQKFRERRGRIGRVLFSPRDVPGFHVAGGNAEMASAAGMSRAMLGLALSMGSGRECPLCGWTGWQFLPRTDPRKPSADAFCPRCGSAERHRFAFLALKSRFPALAATLHCAPEPPVEKWLRSISSKYLSCDLDPGRAMTVEDITRLSFANERFDFIWCSHVLEHVPDDKAAMAEFRRVLKSDGTCVVQVPIWRRITLEDPTITTAEGRRRAFGQTDHVRLYGLDIEERLKESGFKVETILVRDFDLQTIGRHSLNHASSGELFLCKAV
jgi:SAM-dependent methyltransferase